MNHTDSIDLTRFDVREIPCRVKHAQILQRWSDLPVRQHFVLINDHDPIPLYYQFAAQFPGAFEWEYLVRGPDEFQVKITKLAAVAVASTVASPTGRSPAINRETAETHEIDARGLEPPEPLIRILLALEALPAGRKLRAITDRRPCHLFGEAEQRGFRHDCTEQPDGSWVTHLARN
jgi:uncharacterized protein (DUF2249 family)